MNLNHLEKIVREIQTRKPNVVVIGSFFLDGYWTPNKTLAEPSRETGLPNTPITGVSSVRYSLGGSSNIAWNLKGLGANVYVIGVVGNSKYDVFYPMLMKLFEEHGINTDYIVRDETRLTPVYNKLINDKGREISSRIDFQNGQLISERTTNLIKKSIDGCFEEEKIDAVIIGDQERYGIFTYQIIYHLNGLAESYEIPFVVDSRYDNIKVFRNMLLKPNEVEAAKVLNESLPTENKIEIFKGWAKLMHMYTGRPIFITLGEYGAVFYDCKESKHVPALPIKETIGEENIDAVGAGDTWAAWFATSLAIRGITNASYEEIVQLSHAAAAVTIQKIGITGTATPKEVLDLIEKYSTHLQTQLA